MPSIPDNNFIFEKVDVIICFRISASVILQSFIFQKCLLNYCSRNRVCESMLNFP